MQFSNKLNFLMNITNTSNKELAEGISVDRSQACHEYLMRMADLVGYTGIRRSKIRMQINELIQELRD